MTVSARLSVCLASYNGEKYIRRQLETILSQLGPNDEVIVSDDSSTDATLEIVRSFEDPRIRLFPGQTFYSPIYNFEHALKQATGDVIILSDQDDVWLDGRVELIRKKFADPPHRWYLIVTDGLVVDPDEVVTHESLLEVLGAGRGVFKNLWNNRYIGCSMAFTRELLEVALPFPDRLPMHDMWLGQLCEWIGATEFVPVKTIKYRKHAASQTEFKIRFRPWLQIKRRWWLLWRLLQGRRKARRLAAARCGARP